METPWRYLIYFYPRSPCGERRVKRFHAADISYFYPRSPCGERRHAGRHQTQQFYISIHALLAESDRNGGRSWMYVLYFYPRSPCGERQNRPRPSTGINNFYPRSPCGERRLNLPSSPIDKNISIHALLAESDFPLFRLNSQH